MNKQRQEVRNDVTRRIWLFRAHCPGLRASSHLVRQFDDKLLNVRRTDLMDTKDWAHREMLRLLDRLSPAERLQMVVRAVDMGREIHEAAIKRLSSEADPHQ
jgi:hypothetical protein